MERGGFIYLGFEPRAIDLSQFGLSGLVEINQPDIDPSQGLTELPETVVDPSALIAQDPRTPVNAVQKVNLSSLDEGAYLPALTKTSAARQLRWV